MHEYLGLVFVAAFAGGSLVEYGLHRLMHAGFMRKTFLGRAHAAHHLTQTAQTWWREGIDYTLIALPYGLVGLFAGWPFGVAWLLGSISYAFVAGFVHANSHESPCRETPGSHHSIHHHFPRKNYGITTSLWDRVFRSHGKT